MKNVHVYNQSRKILGSVDVPLGQFSVPQIINFCGAYFAYDADIQAYVQTDPYSVCALILPNNSLLIL
jgi:hypothetical protein